MRKTSISLLILLLGCACLSEAASGIGSVSAVQECTAQDNLPCNFGKKIVITYYVTPNYQGAQYIAVSSDPIQDGDDAYMVQGSLSFYAPYPYRLYQMSIDPSAPIFNLRRAVSVIHMNLACNCGQPDYTCCVHSTSNNKNWRRFCGIRDVSSCQSWTQGCTSYALSPSGPEIQTYNLNFYIDIANVSVIYTYNPNPTGSANNSAPTNQSTIFTVGLAGAQISPMTGIGGFFSVEITDISTLGVQIPNMEGGHMVRPADEDILTDPDLQGYDRMFLWVPDSQLQDECVNGAGTIAMSAQTYCTQLECDRTCTNCVDGSFQDRLDETNNCQTQDFLLPLESYSCLSGTNNPLGWQVPHGSSTDLYELKYTFDGTITILITLPLNDTDNVGLVTRYSTVVGAFGDPSYVPGTETMGGGHIVIILTNKGSWDTRVCPNITCDSNVLGLATQCGMAKAGTDTEMDIQYVSNTVEGGQCCLALRREIDGADVFNGCLNVTANDATLPHSSDASVHSSGECFLGICGGSGSGCGITNLGACFDNVKDAIVTIVIIIVICVALVIFVVVAIKIVKVTMKNAK